MLTSGSKFYWRFTFVWFTFLYVVCLWEYNDVLVGFAQCQLSPHSSYWWENKGCPMDSLYFESMYLVSTEENYRSWLPIDTFLGLKISPNLPVLFLDKTCNRVLSRFFENTAQCAVVLAQIWPPHSNRLCWFAMLFFHCLHKGPANSSGYIAQ